MQANLIDGRVVRVTGAEVRVDIGDGRVESCMLRGRLRLKDRDFQVVAGDRVMVRPPGRGGEAWAIEELAPRGSWLSRYLERESAERVIVANVDKLYVVGTLVSPRVHYEFIDRVLVSAERGAVPASVVLNKTDLAAGEEMERFTALYSSCGYPVLRTSALTGDGVARVADELGEGVYAFVGESGVGKSSLLMSLDPELDLKVREIGDKSRRGRHTTTFSQLYRFGDGYLVDTPGLQSFAFPGTDKKELPECFPEFGDHAAGCKFHPCSHSHEPECGVKRALEEGAIEPTRYRSYLNILSEVEARSRRSGR